ncbi:MAG: hypothetical protein LBS95_00880 [Mycoplasmataceae bacterium]|nr:hypothetical protein [Mycoplasmataceae bacterium]
MAIKMKYGSIIISITFSKVTLWISGLWLFIMAILSACGVSGTVLFNGKDNGAIILITTFSFIFVTTFVKHKWGKLVAGFANLGLALAGIIGALITSTWVIFVAELVAIIGCVIWILVGCGVIKENAGKTKKATATSPSTAASSTEEK